MARIRSMRSEFITVSMIGSDGLSMTWTMPSGAPACFGGAVDEARRVGAAGLGGRVRADDDRVPGEEREDRLVEDRADRVGRWRQREDHAGGLGDRHGLRRLVDDGVGEVLVGVVLVEADRAEPVLDLLVVDDAEAGLLDRPFGVAPRLGRRRLRHGGDDRHHRRARIGGVGRAPPSAPSPPSA